METPIGSVGELSSLIETRAVDPTALSGQFLDRIDKLDPTLNAFIATCRDAALADAAAAAARAASGRRLGPLDGIPVAVKDNIDIVGMPTGNGFAGSDRLPPWRVPTTDATVVQRLRDAGAIILGKLNMHEGALGATTDNPHTGRTMNPHRLGFTPGGSSGGSGAAVAAGLCAAALGTDTGGSVRIPASYCGVVGFKPSFGAISTQGVVPLSWRLDHVGVLARAVADARLLFEALRGFDPGCSESRRLREESKALPNPGSVRLGVPTVSTAEPIAAEIAAAFDAAIAVFRNLGCDVRPVSVPCYDSVRVRRAALLRIEIDAALVHADLLVREPRYVSADLRGYLDYGATAKAVRLAQADRIIDVAAFELLRAFDHVDAIVSPTTPQSAFAFGMEVPTDQNAFALPANLAGCPAISVPMGRSRTGLPLGLQIVGAVGRDAFVLDLAEAYEKAADWRLAPPPPFAPA